MLKPQFGLTASITWTNIRYTSPRPPPRPGALAAASTPRVPPALRLAWAGPLLNGIALVAGLGSGGGLSGPAPGQPRNRVRLYAGFLGAGFFGRSFLGGSFWAVPFGFRLWFRFWLGFVSCFFGSGFSCSFWVWESLFFRVWLLESFWALTGMASGFWGAGWACSGSLTGFGIIISRFWIPAPAQGAAISLWGAGGVGASGPSASLAHVPLKWAMGSCCRRGRLPPG